MSPNLATLAALDACVAWASTAGGQVLVVASSPHLCVPLLSRLEVTQGLQCLLLSDGSSSPPVGFDVDLGDGFVLAWLQPVRTDLNFLGSVLRHPRLQHVIVLQASLLGRRLLAEWSTQPTHCLMQKSTIQQILGTAYYWSSDEFTVGNLCSLLWGFLGARSLALGRPDLADRCNARMRRHLFPAVKQGGPVYISLMRGLRAGQLMAGASSDLDRQLCGVPDS